MATEAKRSMPKKPLLALNQQEAADALSVTVNTFKSAVAPHVKCYLVAGMKRWRPEDLDAWLKKQRA